MKKSNDTKKFVMLIFGAPASGKYTISQKIAERTQAVVLDNHHFNNVIMPFVDIDNHSLPDICLATYQIRTLFLDVVKKHYKKQESHSYVFTNVLLDDAMDYAAFDELVSFAKDIDAVFIPVELCCREDVLCHRVTDIQRAERFKLTDKDILKSFLETHKMATIKHDNLIRIDVSDKTAEEVTDLICQFI